MAAIEPVPAVRKEDIIPIPGGIIPRPIDSVARAATDCLTGTGLLTDRIINLSTAVDSTMVPGYAPLRADLDGALTEMRAHNVVTRLSQATDLRAPDHMTSWPGLREARDTLLPPSAALTGEDATADVLQVTVREPIYSSPSWEGFVLVGASPVPTTGTGVPDPHTLLEPPTPGTAHHIIHTIATVDWMVGLQNLASKSLIQVSEDSALQKDPGYKARTQNGRAFALLLLPSLQGALFWWHQLRRVAFIPEVAAVLKRLDHPIARGDEHAPTIQNIESLPMAPSLHAAVAQVGARAQVDSLFGPTEVVAFPHWALQTLAELEANPAVRADPVAPFEEFVSSLFGTGSPYQTLTRTLASIVPEGSELREVISWAAQVLNWSPPPASSPYAGEQHGLFTLPHAHTDGLTSDVAIPSLYEMRFYLLLSAQITGTGAVVTASLADIGATAPRPMPVPLDQTMRPQSVDALSDPATVAGVADVLTWSSGDAEMVRADLDGLVLLGGFRSREHLVATIDRNPARWAHLVRRATTPTSQYAWEPIPSLAVYVRSGYTRTAAYGQLIHPGTARVRYYHRLAFGQVTREAGQTREGPAARYTPRFLFMIRSGRPQTPYALPHTLES